MTTGLGLTHNGPMKRSKEYTPKTIFEPFKIRSVEPLPILSRDRRLKAIEEANYNLFRLSADDVTFDLLTDSGTSAMSCYQWAGIIVGDEAYAGSRSFRRFEETIQKLTGMGQVIPTHQGRSAEALLMQTLVQPGQVVVGNTHFDTTRANIEAVGAEAVDLPCKESRESKAEAPFKGNVDCSRLKEYLMKHPREVALIIMTITNNSVGGQPVSMSNLKEVRDLADQFRVPLYIDAARFAENSYFIKKRESGFDDKSVRTIAHEIFSLADGVLMSAKKDAFGNIGGFLALRSESVAEQIRTSMVITEGFPTYGGLAGRDLEALAIGLDEILDENYLSYRIRSTAYFGEGLERAGFQIVKPVGGHAVYVDAGATLPHIPVLQYPAQALAVALYEEIGIRGVEVGTVMLGHVDPSTGKETPAPQELLRLAIPRRVYTQSHVDYMIEMATQITQDLDKLGGYELTYQAPVLRHFTARFRKL